MGIYCGDRYFNSFEELGQDILRSLPEKRQRVKWWKLHKPKLSRYQNCMARGIRRILAHLPHVHTSRSWVGYFWIHLFLFNRWCILFSFGHWEEVNASVGVTQHSESLSYRPYPRGDVPVAGGDVRGSCGENQLSLSKSGESRTTSQWYITVCGLRCKQ